MNKLDFSALAQRLLISADNLIPQWLHGGRRPTTEFSRRRTAGTKC